MPRIADTIEALGVPRQNGAPGTIRIASGRRVGLTWDADDEMWTSRRYLSMRQMVTLGMRTDGAAGPAKYPFAPELPAPINPRPFGFQIHKVTDATELYDAGLVLQEYLSVEIQPRTVSDGDDPPAPFLNWYELAAGDDFLSPLPENSGVQLPGDLDTLVYKAWSSGWQTSPVPQPIGGAIWYPEWYQTGPESNLRRWCAWHRWAGGPGVPDPGDGGEPASEYPPLDQVISWHRATDIPRADGQQVSEWADYSGRGRHLLQATTAKQPIVRRDGAGQLRHVRFDGSNDVLRTSLIPGLAQPVTVFMVVRQQLAGATQQVWLGPASSGPSLIYRFDATDQVSAWAGGTDLTYHRGSTWPSPWMVISVVLDTTTTIWENLTQVASGDAGGGGLSGLVIGNTHGETLPARIDVAEIIVTASAVGDTARGDLVTALMTRYGIS